MSHHGTISEESPDNVSLAPDRPSLDRIVYLIVEKKMLKTVKDELDRHTLFDRKSKIEVWDPLPTSKDYLCSFLKTPAEGLAMFIIPTLISVPKDYNIHCQNFEYLQKLISLPTTLRDYIYGIIGLAPSQAQADERVYSRRSTNPLVISLNSFLRSLPFELLLQASQFDDSEIEDRPLEQVIKKFPFQTHYTLYYPELLLLPQATFSSPEWTKLFLLLSSEQRNILFETMAQDFKVSYVATSGFIPVDLEKEGTEEASTDERSEKDKLSMILRLPSEIKPQYGFLGPLENHTDIIPVKAPFFSHGIPSMTHPASQSAVDTTVFVTVRQFGLALIFPPLRCMFSRGNVRERERLLRVLQEPQPSLGLSMPPRPMPCSAVDLFAGIGYFSFCYAASSLKSGVQFVATWEINGWSVEAMYQGVVSNGWNAEIICLGDSSQSSSRSTYSCARKHAVPQNSQTLTSGWTKPEFRIHHAPHQTAREIISTNRRTWPPIRHVNLGYLPLSSTDGAWTTALLAIDTHHGGWIRVHENVSLKPRSGALPGEDALVTRSREIVSEFKVISSDVQETRGGDCGKNIKVVDITKVKSYSPGVVHCVFDVWIPGINLAEC